MTGADVVAEFDRLLEAHPEVAADGFVDLCDPPATARPSLRHFTLALTYLSKRAPADVSTGVVAKRASHALFDILLGEQIGDGAVILASISLGYRVIRPQEGGSAWLYFPEPTDA